MHLTGVFSRVAGVEEPLSAGDCACDGGCDVEGAMSDCDWDRDGWGWDDERDTSVVRRRVLGGGIPVLRPARSSSPSMFCVYTRNSLPSLSTSFRNE
jgi:hypothetical protein